MSPLTEAQQLSLLRLARATVEVRVRNLRQDDLVLPSDVPSECCGVFVSLHKVNRLRGCIGHIEAPKPLPQTVRDCAIAAATSDPRFDPVTQDELIDLRIEISVLSPFFEISPDDLEVGRHGLFISRGVRRGLLLPQVAVHWKWDREQFLRETCRKAGLDEYDWRYGAKIQAFTAQVFAESSDPAHYSPNAA